MASDLLPPHYGTLPYQFMLAWNLLGGYRTVWCFNREPKGLWWMKYVHGTGWDYVRPVIQPKEENDGSSEGAQLGTSTQG